MKITVVTICKNAETHIEETILSVRQQTYSDIEYVIIDGKSDDNTLRIVERYRSIIQTVISEPDHGIYNAMNKALRYATGDVVYFLNSDDTLADSGVLADVMEIFIKNPDINLVYGDVRISRNGNMKKTVYPDKLSRQFLAMTTICHQAIFAKKELFSCTEGFDENYRIVSDYDWLMKLIYGPARYRHLPRIVATVSAAGISYTTCWENEKKAVLKKYYSTSQIILWRTLPRFARACWGRLFHSG